MPRTRHRDLVAAAVAAMSITYGGTASAQVPTDAELAFVERVGGCLSTAEFLRALGVGDSPIVRNVDRAVGILRERLPEADTAGLEIAVDELRSKLRALPSVIRQDARETGMTEDELRNQMIGVASHEATLRGCHDLTIPDWFRDR